MSKSNIFVYTELSKLTASLTNLSGGIKQQLKSQAGYFNIITPKYFSENLMGEWENITGKIRKDGPSIGPDGQIRANAIINTIDRMSQQECIALTNQVISLYEKVKQEFEK
ncbi:hypothetical protein ACFP1I_13330 [Dyadobacter subterraneus]|uniref:Uncharacterized protein n=1 Tax=Dyadobacter subterraneus TaxID=2773304 RepID=A0ABR9W9T7_9BACT|nr:hypothetical protein [Dyadobacter subterraneus]MBE9462215.1 hypothetical protein [Dyadobacter subterraneus]